MAKAEPRVVREFAKGVRTSNAELCARCIEELEEKSPGLFKAAMQAIAKSPCGSDEFRLRLLGVWVSCGDAIRHATNDDLALVGGLRAMLPRYIGPAITLYRAESAYNRKRRTYGLSWTSSAEVGREFAKRAVTARTMAAVCCWRRTLRRPQSYARLAYSMIAMPKTSISLTAAVWVRSRC